MGEEAGEVLGPTVGAEAGSAVIVGLEVGWSNTSPHETQKCPS